MNGPFETVWKHIEGCAQCENDLRRLCKVGRKRLEEATNLAAERIFYVPSGPRAKA